MIWIDVTEVKNWKGHHTGIQRVITKLGEQLVADPSNFKTCYYEHATNTFKQYDYDFSEEVVYAQGDDYVISGLRRKFKALTEKLKTRSPRRLKNHIRRASRSIKVDNLRHPDVDFIPGDTLLLPGAFWVYPFEQIKKIKTQKSITIAGVMYDLVPLVVPQYTAPVTIEGFAARFKSALNTFDTWFAISQNTKNDMLAEAARHGVRISEDSVRVIRLGVDEPDESYVTEKPSDLPPDVKDFALFVSTLEARKNQALVYQAVKRLQEQGKHHLPVVLVGKHGWLSDDLVYVLKNDGSIAERLLWLDKVDDRGLRWLYENCSFTIYPSYYEGWGLPVAESLALGKPCVASNSSSIPEVAGEFVEYFSPFSADELAELMIKYSSDKYLDKRTELVKGFQPPSWKACAKVVRQSLLANS